LENKVVVFGENPSPQEARDYAESQDSDNALQLAVIMWKESHFDQFYDDQWDRYCSNRNIEYSPLWGAPNGYGIGQIDPPDNIAQLWNWHKNVEKGIEVYGEKEDSANRYVGQVRDGRDAYRSSRHRRSDGNIGYPNAVAFNEEQIQTDIYQLYQGGHYYIWRPYRPDNLDGPGHWIMRPSQYEDQRDRTGDDRYDLQQQIEAGNEPEHWNDEI